MKNYKRKPDSVQAYKYTGDVAELGREIGTAFVLEREGAVDYYSVRRHNWNPLRPGDYIVKDEDGSYESVPALEFEREYEEISLNTAIWHPNVIGARGTTFNGGFNG